MPELIGFFWPAVPAGLLISGGIVVAGEGIRRGLSGPHLRRRDPFRALGILRGFRGAVIGLCMAAVGVALLWGVGWLLLLSLVIGGQELLESSVHIAALRHGSGSEERRRSGQVVYCGALPPIA